MKSTLTRILAIIVLLALVVTPVAAVDTPQYDGPRGGLERSDLVPLGALPDKYNFVAEEPESLTSLERSDNYLILFEEPSLAAVRKDVQQLDTTTPQNQSYLETLAVQRNQVLVAAERTLARELKVQYVYDVILNGVSVELSPEEVQKLANVDGIRKILPLPDQTLDTDAGPTWIGADGIWEGTSVPDGVGNNGEGILVGIIDSGINFDHPSFSATPTDGYSYAWTGDYLGVCAPEASGGDPAYATACNNKLVGAYSYTTAIPADTETPEDIEGHGSHTASTVAGNVVGVDFLEDTVTISGVAPHAQIIAYDVCYPTSDGGICDGAGILAAINQAVEDGVDVINYSISGGENPYGDATELAFLDAFGAGVVVSASAGNSGPTAGTVAHRSPWVITTAASTHNRKYHDTIVNFSNTLYQNISTFAGEIPFSTEVLSSPIKYSGEDGDGSNVLGCLPFTPDFFAGNIALIKRGVCGFTDKILNAQNAGATGVIIFTNTNPPGGMSVTGTLIPAVMLDVSGAVGDAIAAWVTTATDDTVSLTAFYPETDDAFGDIMADFSSRGPNNTFDVLKPDVSAPGVQVLAAVADGTIESSAVYELALYDGTSMSSPHDAGAAALLTAEFPSWTPAMIKSALMLTAYDGMLKEDGITPADPLDMGSGRLDLHKAALTGLVMDETFNNMKAADPDAGGDVRTLNIASLYNSECVGSCSWTRTFTSVADVAATYTVTAPAWVTVTPASFTIQAGGTQEVTFEVDATALPGDEWAFGNIEFITDDLFPGPMNNILAEDFEVWPPAGWTIEADPASCDTWLSTADTASDNYTGGTGLAADANSDFCGGAMDTWMISPVMNLSEYSTYTLTFKSDFNDYGNLDDGYVDVSVDGGTNWTNVFHYDSADFYGPRIESVDLSAYAGQTSVQLRFHYVAPDWDWGWQVDDVSVDSPVALGKPISDVAVPVAVVPVSGNIPDWVSFQTHRDAGGGTMSDLLAVEITDFSVDTFGFVKGVPTEIQLAQDPTNADPFDNLSQVWYTTVDMTNGAARLVAEITATTAADLDLFWGFDVNGDGMPQEAELYEASAAAGSFEYLSDWGFPLDFYPVWILVQNWKGSGAVLDDITLMLGVVGYDMYLDPSMQVIGPETNTAFTPFDIDVLWSGIDTEEGDRLYGVFDAYADALYNVPIGLGEVDVVRGADDVVKTADVETAQAGDTITYTIEISNFTLDPIGYTINDVLPDGVTYVPDSVTGGAIYDSVTNAITWSGPVDASYRDYVMTTSQSDTTCAMPLANSGAYVNLNAYGVTLQAISGEGTWRWTVSGDPINFYGQNVGNDLRITDDGYAYLAAFSDKPLVNADIPTTALPNNLLAFFWRDLVVNYDATSIKGISLANLTTGGIPTGHIVEMDDVSVKDNPAQTYDIEMYLSKTHDDTTGEFEVTFAYDNIVGPLDLGTIGIENGDGTAGVKFAYNDTQLATITNGSAICFDWALLPAPPVVITFQVTVDEDLEKGAVVTNTALHDNDNPGSVEEAASAAFTYPLDPKINEFSISTTGDDVEYLEFFGSPNVDYSEYTFLALEGDWSTSNTNEGKVDNVIQLGTTDANGLYLINLTKDTIENGTISLLLVKGNTATVGLDLDTNDDGVLESEPWSEIVDSVAIKDSGPTDLTYTTPVLGVNYDGLSPDNAPGGASRIPDGYDTDTATDWVRNDFYLYGIPGYEGFPLFGQAINTPGEFNQIVNDSPVAVADTYFTDEDTDLVVATPGVLTNDHDVNGQTLIAELVEDVTIGTLTFEDDGSFTYVPELDFNGEDTFSYKAFDGYAYSDVVTVTITVSPINDAAVAVDDAYTVVEDGLLEEAAPGVLENDTDIELDNMVATLVTDVKYGSLVLLGDGSFTYTPEADFAGTDTFIYRLVTYPNSTMSTWIDEATVTITVTPVNDAPVLDAIGAKSGDVGAPITFTARATDADLPAQTLTFSLTGTVPAGAAIDEETGVFTWTPTVAGAYTFTVQVCDNAAVPLCDTEEITITVNAVVPDVFTIYLPLILK